jgi:hypothetical protein
MAQKRSKYKEVYIFGESRNSLGRKTKTRIFVGLNLCALDKMLRTLACFYLYLHGVSDDVICLSCDLV